MAKINRTSLMKAHALLAAFILPVAIMFFTTGVLYTFGIKGDYLTNTYNITLTTPIQGELNELLVLTKQALKKQAVAMPSGQARIKSTGTSYKLEWAGSNRDVIFEPTSQPLIAKLSVKETNWHRRFVQLHKAKGGILFKIYAAVFTTAIFILLISGFIMAWQMPKLRKQTLASTVLGMAVFIVMVAFS